MGRGLRLLLAFQSIPILLSGLQALFSPSTAAAPGTPYVGTPTVALHVAGLSSITLGVTQLVLAVQGSQNVLRAVLAAMVPTKILAAAYFYNDGFWGVSIWEGATGLIYSVAVGAKWWQMR